MSDEARRELLALMGQRLESMSNMADDWTNGTLRADEMRPTTMVRIADLLVSYMSTEIAALKSEMQQLATQ